MYINIEVHMKGLRALIIMVHCLFFYTLEEVATSPELRIVINRKMTCLDKLIKAVATERLEKGQ